MNVFLIGGAAAFAAILFIAIIDMAIDRGTD